MPDPAVPKRASKPGHQTLDRAIAILSMFQEGAPEWSAAQVARELDLTLSTASRIMRALEAKGLLRRSNGRSYSLGFAAVELGIRAMGQIDIRQKARPALVELARSGGETSLLGVIDPDRLHARVVDRVEGRDTVRVTLELGRAWPLHAGALAKVLLAHMPDRETVLRGELRKVGRRTVTDESKLRAQLDEIREQGWALTAEESETDGIWGVAAPVLDTTTNSIASVGVVVPQYRRTKARERELTRLVVEAATRIAHLLGVAAE